MSSLDDLELLRVERELIQAIAQTESLLGPEELAALDRRQQPHQRFPGQAARVFRSRAGGGLDQAESTWATTEQERVTDVMDPTLPGPNYGRLPSWESEPSSKAMSETTVMAALQKEYQAADVNGDGVLQPLEMVGLLTQVPFNLSYREAAAVVNETDVNQDNLISFEEFAPTVLNLLAALRIESNSQRAEIEGGDHLRRYLTQALQAADTCDGVETEGRATPMAIARVLGTSGLRFSDATTLDVILSFDLDRDGCLPIEASLTPRMACGALLLT